MDDKSGTSPNNLSTEDASFKGWSACASAMRSYDEELVKGWKEDIDTMLLLAGLFSAVLTSFVLQSYPLLQPDPQTPMLVYMHAIVSHLDSQSGSTNASSLGPPSPSLSYQAPSSAVRVNAMWFAGLVLTLIAAILGILGKQWLREYVHRRVVSPQDTVRLRQLRYGGLSQWRVFEILSLLPFLLLSSLVLFLLGLLDFLWSIIGATAVAIPAITIVSLFFCLASVSTILPLFYSTCPYKSPVVLQLRSLIVLFGHVYHRLANTFREAGRDTGTEPLEMESWWDTEMHELRHQSHRLTDQLDARALMWAHTTVLDDYFQDALVPCTTELPPRMRIHLLSSLLAQMAGCSLKQLKMFVRRGPDGATRALYRGLLRSGNRTTERYLNLLLDAIPDAGHFTFLERSRDTDGLLGRQDLFQLFHPLLGALLSGRRNKTTRDMVKRVYGMVLGLIPESPDTSFDILLAFSTVFRRIVCVEDVSRMLDASIAAEHPLAESPMGHAISSRERSLVLAAPAVLHYSLCLTEDELNDESWQQRIRTLLRMMCAHVQWSIASGQPYNSQHPQRVSWCWELRRVVQRFPDIIDVNLVEALADADSLGLLPLSERGPLGILKAMTADYHAQNSKLDHLPDLK